VKSTQKNSRVILEGSEIMQRTWRKTVELLWKVLKS